ncbi:hypothetical protein D8674_025575 [Pyrus ussuriensis x Pyrus communis]|uniref:Uncharacterized protein n=1 Tax=Pyrus ussuriensis x Pyrus communis TaxID=2448454 RepID=A0A5N5I8Z5_9ROSA|nr:hypothetical protein D8674_025575 [Pyrus ussuriensis x Pyrus communis]
MSRILHIAQNKSAAITRNSSEQQRQNSNSEIFWVPMRTLSNGDFRHRSAMTRELVRLEAGRILAAVRAGTVTMGRVARSWVTFSCVMRAEDGGGHGCWAWWLRLLRL